MPPFAYWILYTVITALIALAAWKVREVKPWSTVWLVFSFVGLFVYLAITFYWPFLLLGLFGSWEFYTLCYFHWLSWCATPFFLLAAVQVPDERSRKGVIALALLISLSGVLHLGRQIYLFDHTSLPNTPPETWCTQNSSYSCAPASLVNFLKMYGISTTERKMAYLAHTKPGIHGGTNPAGIYYALSHITQEKYQVTAEMASLDRLAKLNRPAMATVLLPSNIVHSIVIMGVENDGVLVLDPLEGEPKKRSFKWMKKIWLHMIYYLDQRP